MKLAEALLEKKNLAGRISELQGRYTAAAVIEEGNQPDESAEDLLNSLVAAFAQWEALTVNINLANNRVVVGERTMMQALAHRDSLKTQIFHFSAITSTIRQRNSSRHYYQEIGQKMIVVEGVDVKAFIKRVDDLSQELRLLDAAIQKANWDNELTA